MKKPTILSLIILANTQVCFLSSCVQKVEPQIFEPTSKKDVSNFAINDCAVFLFENFKFSGIEDPKSIQVYDTFLCTDIQATKETTISYFNKQTHTFSVVVKIFGIHSEKSFSKSGGFIFFVGDKKIETNTDFSINCQINSKIIFPDTKEYYCDTEGNSSEILIRGIRYQNIEDFSKVKIEIETTIQKVIFTPKIIDIDKQEQTFDLLVNMSNLYTFKRLPLQIVFFIEDFEIFRSNKINLTVSKKYLEFYGFHHHFIEKSPIRLNKNDYESEEMVGYFKLIDPSLDITKIDVSSQLSAESTEFKSFVSPVYDSSNQWISLLVRATNQDEWNQEDVTTRFTFSYEGKELEIYPDEFMFSTYKPLPLICISRNDEGIFGFNEITYDPETFPSEGLAFKDLIKINNNAFNSLLVGKNPIRFLKMKNTASDKFEIGERAFYNCYNLESELYIPHNTKRIQSEAFANCKNIESLALNDKIGSIANNAFDGMVGVKTIDLVDCDEIPEWAKKMGEENGIFKTFNPSIKGEVLVKEGMSETWRQYLGPEYCNLPSSWVIKERVWEE